MSYHRVVADATSTLRFPWFLFILCMCIAGLGTRPAGAQTKIIAGPMIGHVSDTSAHLWMQLNTTEEVSIRAIDRMTNREIAGIRAQVEGPSPFILDAPLGGLTPSRSYRLEVRFDGKPITLPSPETILSTCPAPGETENFSVAFGACMSPAVSPRMPVFKAVAAIRPRTFLMLGNCGYLPADLKDWPRTRKEAVKILHQFYLNLRTTADLQPIFRTTPVYATWGEHDFGTAAADRTFPFAQESRVAFMRYWSNPDYGTPDVQGVFFSFSIGDVDFFVLDDRTFRDPLSQPDALYGEGQITWLKDQLQQSRGTFKVIAGASQFLPDDAESDGWCRYSQERRNFLHWLTERRITGVLFISGGRRLGELSAREPDDQNGYTLYEVTSSPLAAPPTEEPQQRPNPLRKGPLVATQNFGTLEFGGPKSKRYVTLRLRDTDGKVCLEKVLFAGELTPP